MQGGFYPVKFLFFLLAWRSCYSPMATKPMAGTIKDNNKNKK